MSKVVLIVLLIVRCNCNDDFFDFLADQQKSYQQKSSEQTTAPVPTKPSLLKPIENISLPLLNDTSQKNLTFHVSEISLPLLNDANRNNRTSYRQHHRASEKRTGKKRISNRFVESREMCIRYILHCARCNKYKQVPNRDSIKKGKISLILHNINCFKESCNFSKNLFFELGKLVCGSPKCSARQCRVEVIEQICCGESASLIVYLIN